jgi:hypothetical protein
MKKKIGKTLHEYLIFFQTIYMGNEKSREKYFFYFCVMKSTIMRFI